MIATLRFPDAGDLAVVLPAAPLPGDVVEARGLVWHVLRRRFVVPVDGEASCVVHVEPHTHDAAVRQCVSASVV